MDIEDRRKILINFYETDKTLNSESFWRNKYQNEHIPFTKYFNDVALNILEFEYSSKCYKMVTDLMSDGTKKINIFINSSAILELFKKYAFYEELVAYFLPILNKNITKNLNDIKTLEILNLYVVVYLDPNNNNILICGTGKQYDPFDDNYKDMDLRNDDVKSLLYDVMYKKYDYLKYDKY